MKDDKAHARRSLTRRLRKNKAAQVLVYLGGLGTIACILGILVFLLIEALPLFGGATIGQTEETVSKRPLVAMATDRFEIRMLGLDEEGALWSYRIRDGKSASLGRLSGLGENEKIRSARTVGKSLFVRTDRERLAVMPFKFDLTYVGSERNVAIELGEVQWMVTGPDAGAILAADATEAGSEGYTVVWQRQSRAIHVVRVVLEYNEMTEETSSEKSEFDIEIGVPASFLRLDGDARNLVAVDGQGRIHWWTIGDGESAKQQVLDSGFGPATCVGLLQADRSLILGNAKGDLRQFFRVRDKNGDEAFREIREFPRMDSGVREFARSSRNKAFLVASDNGKLGLYYATTGKRDWMGDPSLGVVRSIALTPKGNGLLVSGAKGVALLSIDNPHPEASWGTLLGKVWYENYPEPTYTWQSTGGTDDFETKLSLMPLIFGTIKGTFFSMLLAIPLALLAALYASLFLHPGIKKYIKPAIEIMAAIPSVILGFLCAIYIAPLLEGHFAGFLLLPLFVVLFMVLGSVAVSAIPTGKLARLPKGTELFIMGGFLILSLILSFLLGDLVQTLGFGGDTANWVSQVFHVPYEQRNAIVIAMGMSFAVIPIIFSISEDAISNVPRNLVSGSLALGANHWETATRVILPTASPGIFSAIMIGLGRAVGETMIVLMAAGNTPIMDWNPFNGFRTLSANIAVEIPEAPHEGTLYRTLFLSAVLLFLMTFVLNTVAEVVRQNLRKRYANI